MSILSDADLLQTDSRCHIAMDCGRGSLVKLRGMMRIKITIRTRLLTRHNAGVGTVPASLLPMSCLSRPPTKLSDAAAAIVIVSLNREDVQWAKYK